MVETTLQTGLKTKVEMYNYAAKTAQSGEGMGICV